MDANTVLLWLAGFICGAVLVRGVSVRARIVTPRAAIAGLVLAVMGMGYWFEPELAGYTGAALCALFLLAPVYANLWAFKLANQKRFGAARALAKLAILLQPTKAMRGALDYLDALEHPHAAAVADPSTALGRFNALQAFRIENRWAESLAYTSALPSAVLRQDSWVAFQHLRGLAELSQIEALLASFAELERAGSLASGRDGLQLLVAVRLGRVDLVDRLLAGSLGAGMGEAMAAYWRAFALQAAGAPEGEAALRALAERPDPDLARAARYRLATPLPKVREEELSPGARAIVAELAREVESAAGFSAGHRRAPVVIALLAICAGAFVLEELSGGSTDIETLIKLGALTIPKVSYADSNWRLLSAAFLHMGTTHLVMNGLGMWAIGRQVEAVLGGWRTLAVFLASALFGNYAASVLLAGPTVLVGASGGLLGLLGALLAIALRRHVLQSTRFLREQLRQLGFVLVLQALFDFFTPHVSSTVHVAGFIAGFVATLAVAWRKAAQS